MDAEQAFSEALERQSPADRARRLRHYLTSNPLEARPLAAAGLTSYRCRGGFGWIMIGATDPEDAMRQALRSSATASRSSLEVWDAGAGRYVPVLDAAGAEEERRASLTDAERDAEDLAALRAAIGNGMGDLFAAAAPASSDLAV